MEATFFINKDGILVARAAFTGELKEVVEIRLLPLTDSLIQRGKIEEETRIYFLLQKLNQ